MYTICQGYDRNNKFIGYVLVSRHGAVFYGGEKLEDAIVKCCEKGWNYTIGHHVYEAKSTYLVSGEKRDMFETAMFLYAMEQLVKKCYENSKNKGFWDGEDWNFAEKIALIHSELSEAMEHHRKGNQPTEKDIIIVDPKSPDGVRKITGVEEELADAVIRICDLCGKMDIDLGRCILAKMEYNSKRPYKHGRKY